MSDHGLVTPNPVFHGNVATKVCCDRAVSHIFTLQTYGGTAIQKEEESPAVDLRCQPRALLAFGLVASLYILKDFLNSHKDKIACRDGLNGCKGTEVVCN